MGYYYRQGGAWQEGTPRQRVNGQFQTAGTGSSTYGGGFDWDQTFTDTSWLQEADQDGTLNVEKVTTTYYTGSGGLEEAVNNADSYPTVVVFEVGGVIDLGDNDFHINEGPVWVAGETAPSPGISLVRGRCRIYTDNVILSHLSVMPGDEVDEAQDVIVPDGDDILVDHCSGLWGTDEVLTASNSVNRTSFINCICAEGLYDSIHPKGTHSRGFFYAKPADETVGLGNLLAHNNRRNPMTRADLVWCNNYIYNHGSQTFNLDNPEDPLVSSVSNVYEMGPDSVDLDDRALYHFGGTLYSEDTDSIPSGRELSDGDQEIVDEPPIWPSGLDKENDLVPFEEVRDRVTTHAGPRPADRPPVEADLINNRLTDSGAGLIDSQEEVGGYPDYQTTTRELQWPDTDIVDWVREYSDAVEVTG